MRKRILLAVLGVSLVSTLGCPAKSGDDGSGSPVPASESPEPDTPADDSIDPGLPEPEGPAGERDSLTAADCEANKGTVVGDIGDGAIHRSDYKCEGGQPPTGTIVPAEGEPIASDGAVCCPVP